MKISFVNSIEPLIQKLPSSSEVGKNLRYTIQDAKIGKKLYSKGFNTCAGFEINAGEQNLLGHIKPEGLNIRKFALDFEQIIKDFQNKFGEVKALVLGGRESSFVDPMCRTKSNELYGTMCDVLSTKCNIPDNNFASIMGKFKNIRDFDDIVVIGDKIYIANKSYKNLGIQNAPKNRIESLLGEIYEDIFIPDILLT